MLRIARLQFEPGEKRGILALRRVWLFGGSIPGTAAEKDRFAGLGILQFGEIGPVLLLLNLNDLELPFHPAAKGQGHHISDFGWSR